MLHQRTILNNNTDKAELCTSFSVFKIHSVIQARLVNMRISGVVYLLTVTFTLFLTVAANTYGGYFLSADVSRNAVSLYRWCIICYMVSVADLLNSHTTRKNRLLKRKEEEIRYSGRRRWTNNIWAYEGILVLIIRVLCHVLPIKNELLAFFILLSLLFSFKMT